jgi:hypothetical protein
LAYVAGAQQCDAVLLGWHRASLDRPVIRALVHRIFSLASCDVVVFVDRSGDGIERQSSRPIVVVSTVHGEVGVTRTATRLAESLAASVELVPLRAIAGECGPYGLADGMEPDHSMALDAAIRKTAAATVAIVSTGPVWSEEDDFGQPASAFAAVAECPVMVVRSGGVVGAERAAFSVSENVAYEDLK